MATGQRRSGRARTHVASYAEDDLAEDAAFIRPVPAARRQNNKKHATSSPGLPYTIVGGPIVPQTTSRLLALPAGLRNHIYELSFEGPNLRTGRHVKTPPLLLTCKQVFAEALQLFYANTTFEVPDESELQRWLLRIGSARVTLVKSIRFHDEHFVYDAHYGKDFRAAMGRVLKALDFWGYTLGADVVKVRTVRTGQKFLTVGQVKDDDVLEVTD